MSSIGPAGLPGYGLAGSAAAGQQRSPALGDRDQADQALQKLRSDQTRLANRDLDDSIETEFSHGQVSDRDSDGRLPWQRPGDQKPPDEEQPPEEPRARPADPQNGCGGILDVDV